MTAFALIDGNCFYCSCERVFNPSLKGKPLIVLSNNDGCAISRTDEAKAMGIPWIHPLQRIRLGKKGWWRSGKNETVLVSLFTVFGVSIWVQVNPENVFAQGLTQLTQESVKQISVVLQPLVQNFITYLSNSVHF